jgi:hypothetical protein
MRAFVYFLPFLHYLTIMSNHRVATLTIGGDSLVITRAANRPTTLNSPAPADTRRYKIVASEQHGKYWWLYVRQDQAVSLVIFYRSADNRELRLLDEVQTYPTLEACRNAVDTLDPEKKLFAHWYSDAAYKIYTAYPGINTADSSTINSLSTDYVREMVAGAAKAHNTRLADLYGAGTGQDILSKVLIDDHLNPNTTLGELSAKIQQYHILIPEMPIYHSAPRHPSLSADTTQGLAAPRINAPH